MAQDALWRAHALKSLPALMRATQMLVCGEDLGMIPACVHPVMEQLGLVGAPEFFASLALSVPGIRTAHLAVYLPDVKRRLQYASKSSVQLVAGRLQLLFKH